MTPLAYVFFWLARRFMRVQDMQGWQRWKVLILNALIILALGTMPGLYSKFDDRAEQGLTIINGIFTGDCASHYTRNLSNPASKNGWVLKTPCRSVHVESVPIGVLHRWRGCHGVL